MRKGFPRTPSQKLSNKKQEKGTPKTRTDTRREGKPRFGYREKSGTTETLISKRVVEIQCGQPGRSVPTEIVCLIVGDDVLGIPQTNDNCV